MISSPIPERTYLLDTRTTRVKALNFGETQRWNSVACPPGQALERWRETVCRGLIGVEVEPKERSSFTGDFKMVSFGDATLAQVRTSALSASRSDQFIADDPSPGFLVNLLVQGVGESSQCGNRAVVRPGDIFLQDTALPYLLDLDSQSAVITLRTPKEMLRRYMTPSERMLGVSLHREGLSRVAAAALASLASVAHQIGPAECQIALGNILSIVALAAAPLTSNASTSAHLTYRRILAFIDTNLKDPDLSPTKIAETFRISRRQLSRIFEAEEQALSRIILRHRLERCRLDLMAPSLAQRTIGEIAFSWGFNNLSHFSQSFCEAYGCPPRKFRSSYKKQ